MRRRRPRWTTSSEYVRSHRLIVEGHAPVPVALGRAFVPRRAGLGQQDFEDFGYTRDAEDSNIFRRASDSARTTEIDVEIESRQS